MNLYHLRGKMKQATYRIKTDSLNSGKFLKWSDIEWSHPK